MKRQVRRKILISLFIIGLILKKYGIGLSILLTFPSVILLCIEILRSSVSKNHDNKVQLFLALIFSGFFIISLSQLQYWIRPLYLSLSFWIAWLVFSVLFLRYGAYGASHKVIWVLITFLMTCAAFMNPRQYHNFFRASYYEDFIRRKLSGNATRHR